MDCRLCVVTGDLDQTLLSSPLDMLAQTFNQRRDWDSGISLICANHRSSDVACSGSVRRFSSMPRVSRRERSHSIQFQPPAFE